MDTFLSIRAFLSVETIQTRSHPAAQNVILLFYSKHGSPQQQTMQIEQLLKAGLHETEKQLCQDVLSVCQKYPEKSTEGWVTGVLIYTLEVYLRICRTTDECDGDGLEGFVQAHFRPPLLASETMDFAARAIRRLSFEDANMILCLTEERARRVERLSTEEVWRLLQRLSEMIPADGKAQVAARPKSWPILSHVEPHLVCSGHLGASCLSKGGGDASVPTSGKMHFVTLVPPRATFVTDDPVSHPEATVFKEGNAQNGLFSPYCIGRGSWRLTIDFSIFNNTDKTCVAYDIHAKVYNRLKDTGALASVGHSMAVELLADNTILGEHAPVNLDPADSLNVALALEASLFESLRTTIVFGLLVDYYTVCGGSTVKRTLPSDALYVFQHARQMGSQCHFVARTTEQIQKRMESERDNVDVQESCRSLLKAFEQHWGQARD